MSTPDPTLPACAHCGHQDTDEIGDHDSLVARCSTCDVLTCGTCWDELHAETCGGDDFDAADYIADAAALVTCAQCGEQHWYLAETDGMTHMASLPGYTCGQEEPEPAGCDCEGPLHYTTCWWVVHNDDGRPQATGDPAIDYPAPDAEPPTSAPDLAELERAALARTPWPKTPSLTRQHFNYLARILAELEFLADGGRRGGGTVHQYVVEHFAYHLADCNPAFDRERFLTAAGGQS